MTDMTPTLTPRMYQFDRQLARVGIVIGIFAMVCGLAVLCSIVGIYLGLLSPDVTASMISTALSVVGIVVMAVGMLGGSAANARIRLINALHFLTSHPGDHGFTSSQGDIQTPPPRAQRGATATTRRPSDD